MKEWTVERGERDQRFNKYLQRRLPDAPSSFLYKMLRKKNITLNGKKASGSELLQEGDLVTLFLSDDTLAKFGGDAGSHCAADDVQTTAEQEQCLLAYRSIRGRIGKDGILYEDENVLLVRKPVGVLSQKALDRDRSMNEWLIGYLLETGKTDAASLRSFRPSVCNRLDRNTGGILICAKTLAGARKMGALLKDRTLRKYYQAAVLGTVRGSGRIEGILTKDRASNTVRFSKGQEQPLSGDQDGSTWTSTVYRPLIEGGKYSLLELELITGKTHQIRSHLSSLGHPILGDPKYGDPECNERIRSEYGVRGQMLWCCRLEFPHMDGDFAALSEKRILCDPPALYRKIAEAGM